MSSEPRDEPTQDAHGRRVERFTRGADLSGVADVLADGRDEILERWLDATRQQPFHRGRPERAVADHLPHLVDGLVDLLRRTGPRWAGPAAPLDDPQVLEAARRHAEMRYEQGLGPADDPQVLEAARRHAEMRYEQGLGPADVVTEFRLLRQEIGRTLRHDLEASESPADVVAGELIANDALDGATVLSLQALTAKVEEVRADFLATTVHDAQQPISTVKLSVQLALRSLDRGAPEVTRAKDALRRADQSLDRMIVLLRRLADASRVALGGLQVDREATHLRDVVRRVVDDLDPDTLSRVRFDEPDGDDLGFWDPAALEQVVGNLVNNAAKFSPSDSSIEVEIVTSEGEVRLTVRDDGPGVKPEDHERIFRRFERSPTTHEDQLEGQGIGLYLSRGIVEAHDGWIDVESDGDGSGSAFHVVLPRRPDEPETSGGS